jgi:predicted DNA-binding transcriptional regulator AlpA
MNTNTYDAIKAVLRSDPSLDLPERNRLLVGLRSPDTKKQESKEYGDRILRRAEVAERLSISRRTVDAWAKQGLIPKVKLPNRTRMLGCRERDVIALIEGRAE